MANEGYPYQDGQDVIRHSLSMSFPGTLFQVKFNVRDDVTYQFA